MKHLHEVVENTIKDLERTAEEYFTTEDLEVVENFLDGVLEIRRIQTLTADSWKTHTYELVLATGGPHIEVNTAEGSIEGWWYDEHIKRALPTKVWKFLTEVEEYLTKGYL